LGIQLVARGLDVLRGQLIAGVDLQSPQELRESPGVVALIAQPLPVLDTYRRRGKPGTLPRELIAFVEGFF
jgi:hypothetical protein